MAEASRPVFVVGTGRSGTHWLGYSLGNHPEVRSTVEEEPMFGLSTRMALDPSLERKLLGRLVEEYRAQLVRSEPRLYLDKTHPNIWIAEKLKESFPRALFLGIERNPYATVASMLRHGGVLEWHRRWTEFPIPNRFLGISVESARAYEGLPLAAKCSMRWMAHHKRMREIQKTLGGDFLLIIYEMFAAHTGKVIAELKRFLGLRSPIPIPEVKIGSLEKWKAQLSDKEIKQIQGIVGFAPESAKS